MKRLTIFTLLFLASCSVGETPIYLVCSGEQVIEQENLLQKSMSFSEKKKITKTFKFALEVKEIFKESYSTKKSTWVFNTNSQPEIFDENRSIVVDSDRGEIKSKTLKFVFVRNDDISVKNNFSRFESSLPVSNSSYNLNIDRVSGNFKEEFFYRSKELVTSEVFEGICSKSTVNKI